MSAESIVLRACHDVARHHGMFIVARPSEKAAGMDYVVYRRIAGQPPLRIGRRRDPADLHRYIRQLASTKQ